MEMIINVKKINANTNNNTNNGDQTCNIALLELIDGLILDLANLATTLFVVR